MNLTVSSSPHVVQKSRNTRSIMLDVIIALCPCLVMAVLYFGFHVLINAVVCMGSCFAFELLYSLILQKDFSRAAVKRSSCWDLSCLVTGLILALNLPKVAVVKAWNLNYPRVMSGITPEKVIFSGDTVIICIIASLVAIVLVKMLFGGIGKNFANPAATARIFIFLAFGLSAVNSVGWGSSLPASTGATWLSSPADTADKSALVNMFLGNRGAAAAGETSAVAILVGYVYLCVRKVIDFRIPLIILASAAVFAILFDGLPSKLGAAQVFNNMLAHLLSGGLLFGSVFMATDYSTSPDTFLGSVIFGVSIALFTMLIRVFGGYPEGMSFAILIMNSTVPLIDKYIVPKPFGYFKVKKTKAEKGGAV